MYGQPSSFLPKTTKYGIVPQTLCENYDYVFTKQDQQSFNLIKEKYRFGNPQYANKKCSWQDRSLQDIRRQFVDLVKAITSSKTNSVQNVKTTQQSCNHSQILSTIQNYLDLIINNKFQQADNLIKKYDLNPRPQIQKKLNKFSLKMLKYETIVQQNNKSQNLSEQLDFYHKVIQNMHEPKSLQNFINLNKKSPYMVPTLAYKLQRQLFLSNERQEYQKICKKYEKVLVELNHELKKPILQFRYTNIEISNFSCKDFKSKFTQQSGIKLKKSLADLIYNISSSKNKKILSEIQKSSSIKSDHQAWTQCLFNHLLTIVSNEFQQKHFNEFKYFVEEKMPNNKSIGKVFEQLELEISRLNEMKQFIIVLGGLKVTNTSTINYALSMIKPKEFNNQKMLYFFRRQLIYKLMHEIHSDKIVSGNFTLIQSLLNNYKKYIDQNVIKSIERLSFKTGKERLALQDLRTTLHEIQVLTGSNHIATININPNTTDFYIQLLKCTSEIYANLSKQHSGTDKNIKKIENVKQQIQYFKIDKQQLNFNPSSKQQQSEKNQNVIKQQLASDQQCFKSANNIINQLQKQIKYYGLQIEFMSKELCEQKKKYQTQKYLIAELKTDKFKYENKIFQLQKEILKQQDQIKKLKDQLQSKKSNLFKREDEGDIKKPTIFKSLQEIDTNPIQSTKLISESKQLEEEEDLQSKPSNIFKREDEVLQRRIPQFRSLKEPDENYRKSTRSNSRVRRQFNTSGFKNAANPVKKQQELIVKNQYENKTNQTSQKLKQQLQTKQLSLDNKKQRQKVDDLEKLNRNLEKQINELRQLKEKAEKQLFDLRQSIAKYQEEKRKKNQQEQQRFFMDGNNKKGIIKRQIEEKQTQIQQLQLNDQISILQQSLIAQKKKTSYLQSVVQLLNSQSAANFEDKPEKKQQQITQNPKQNQTLISNLIQNVQQLETTLATMKQKQNQSQLLILQKEKFITEYKKKISQLTQELKLKPNSHYCPTCTQLKSQNQQLKNCLQIKSIQSQFIIQDLKNLSIKQLKEIQEIQKQKITLEHELKTFKIVKISPSNQSQQSSSQLNTELQSENKKLKENLMKLELQIFSQAIIVSELNRNIEKLQTQLRQKYQQIDYLQKNLYAPQQTIKNLKLQYKQKPKQSIHKSPQNLTFKFFNHQILSNQDDRKELLVKVIEQKLKLTIKNTKLIYFYDPVNSASFHNYIDGKENFLIIVYTQNNKIFGAFSTSKIQKNFKQPENAMAFLFTFNPELGEPITCFNMKKKTNANVKSLIWDESHIMIGNTEIRWKKGQKHIRSNFALPQGYYDPNGKKIRDFIQEQDQREPLIKGFECYQIYFDQ